MNVYNNFYNSETYAELLSAGYKQVSEIKFQKHFSKQYSTKILQCCYLREESGKKIKINKKQYKKLKSAGQDVFIRQEFFSKKIEKQLAGSSSIGTLEILPIELFKYIFGFLSPFELNKIKPVSSAFCRIASDNSLVKSEYEIAWKILELIQSNLFANIQPDEKSKYLKTIMYFDANGNLQTYKEEYDLYVRDLNSDHFKRYDSRNTLEMTEHLYKLSLYWHYDIHELSEVVPCQRTPSQNSLGVWTHQRHPFKNEIVNKVAEHIITLANQLYAGANEIAKKEGKIHCDWLRYPVRPLWENVIKDSMNYPMNKILEAGPLNMETQPKKKVYKKGIVYPVTTKQHTRHKSPIQALRSIKGKLLNHRSI